MSTPKQRLKLAKMILDETSSLLSKDESSKLCEEFSYLRECVDNFDVDDDDADKFSIETLGCVLMACSIYFSKIADDVEVEKKDVVFFPKEAIVNVLLDAAGNDYGKGVMGMNINVFLRKVGWGVAGDSSSSE